LDHKGKFCIKLVISGGGPIGGQGDIQLGIPVSQVVEQGQMKGFQLKPRLSPQIFIVKSEGIYEILKYIFFPVPGKAFRNIKNRPIPEIPEYNRISRVGSQGDIDKFRDSQGKIQAEIETGIGILL
jgi:hypothetical protein